MQRLSSVILGCLLALQANKTWAQQVELFDGKSLDAWMLSNGKPVSDGWEVVDGTIHLKKGKRAGNILTREEFGNFDLSFEWAIAKGGNSGIKYRVKKFNGRTLGCEYQIFDDASQKLKPKHKSASLYALYAPTVDNKGEPAETLLKPVGEFNSARIVVRGNKIDHWLNGHLVVSARVGSPEWKKTIAASKFANVEGFGVNAVGRLMLTDHGSEVWYRNFEMKRLPASVLASTNSRSARRGRFERKGPLRRSLGNLRSRLRRGLRSR